jgi:mRNA-degrading endonuclease toxin of MazEF toxin-antitoxin module
VLVGNLRLADSPGNVPLAGGRTGRVRESVAYVSQIVTPDNASLVELTGRLPTRKVELILDSIDVALGR